MAKANSNRPRKGTIHAAPGTSSPVAALRFLAAVVGQFDNAPLSSEEAYGLEVILKNIASQIEGGAA